MSVREDGADKLAVRKNVVSRAYHLSRSCDTMDTICPFAAAEQIVFAGCTEDLRQWRVASGNGAAMSRWEGFAADIADTV